MKKLLMIGSALALISTSAMASQARLLALGMKETDNDGMYHVSDARNIFLNPAYINIYNNYVTTEYGQNGFLPVATSSVSLDRDTAPKAQGGFFTKQGDFVYGLYIGNESNTSALLRAAGTSAIAITNQVANGGPKTLQSADNQFDLFFGGESTYKWAVNTTYASGKNDARKEKDSAIALRSGLIGSNWDAHVNLSLASKAEADESILLPVALGGATVNVKQEFKGKLGFHIGGSYVYSGNNRVFGYVKHYGWEQVDSFTGYSAGTAAAGIGGQNGTVKGDFTSMHAGWGTHYDTNSTDKVFVSLSARKTDINLKFTTKGEVRNLILPISIAYEAKANEWLTLRGSVAQNLWGTKDNKGLAGLNQIAKPLIEGTYGGGNGKGSYAASTEVNGGATFSFGKLTVDGLIGAKATGSLKTDDLLTRAAVTYKF